MGAQQSTEGADGDEDEIFPTIKHNSSYLVSQYIYSWEGWLSCFLEVRHTGGVGGVGRAAFS